MEGAVTRVVCMGDLVSVIIPTLGRSSLIVAVNSALAQTYPVHEVIVVDASQDGLGDGFFFLDERVRVVRAAESVGKQHQQKWTAAENRNIGVRAATGEWVAFLDDDDTWFPEKTSIQLTAALRLGSDLISCRAVYKLPSGKCKVRPARAVEGDIDVLRALYGNRSFGRLDLYVATPSLMVRRRLLLEIPQPENLPGFEDTWWLHLLQRNGHQLHQVENPLVFVNADPMRSIARDSVEKNRFWAELLASVDRDFAANYLLGVCHRNAALLGRSEEIRELRKLASGYRRLSYAEIAQSTGLGAIARLVAVFRRVGPSQ